MGVALVLRFWTVVFVAVFARLLAFVVFENWDVVNDSGIPIKWAGKPAYQDYAEYKQHIGSAWSSIDRPFIFFQVAIQDLMAAWQWLHQQAIKPGPFFSYLLSFFNFESNRTFLSGLYLLLGSLLGISWARLLEFRGGSVFVQLLVACYPALVYYSFLVSTDLLYAVLIAFFYAAAWGVLLDKKGALYWCMPALLAAVMTRPNGIAMIPVLFVLLAQHKSLSLQAKLFWVSSWSVLGIYMLIYYLPYFWVHEHNAISTHYWGILPEQFYAGLITFLPSWMSQLFSIIFLGLSKLIYSVGLRPSYSDINIWLVIARALPGLFLLPGLIYGALHSHWFDKIFMLFFLLPVYVGASQERYLLAVTPLLTLWGVAAYIAFFSRLRVWLKPKYLH